MALFRFVLKYARGTLVYSVFAGLFSGFSLSGMMVVIHRALDAQSGISGKLVGAFILLWLLYGGLCILSESLLIRLSERIAFQLKQALSRQVFAKELQDLEEIGSDRIFAFLVEDIAAITEFVGRLPNAFINIAIVTGCYGYMAWLSPSLFLCNLVFLMVAVMIFKIPSTYANRLLAKARETKDRMMGQYSDLSGGLKELILHRPKRRDFLTRHLHETDRELMEQNLRAKSVYAVSQRLGDFLILLNIGCLIFLAPLVWNIAPHLLTGFILAALFSLSPLSTLLGFIPHWAKVDVSLKKVQAHGFDLFHADGEEARKKEPNSPGCSSVPRRLALENVGFEYTDRFNGDRFSVGPISFELRRGETTFIVGGNGSGKTTLAKVICGLYPPMAGRILWGGEPVHSKEGFYENFSVFFSDYHLFRHLMGIAPEKVEKDAQGYLKKLELDEKVRVENGAFSTTDLSFGQKKRLALLAFCLEDRPVYIFDEWAAGQDPVFKEVFYGSILPELKRKNKMLVVITHDDRYFHTADQLIKLENGKIIST